VIRDPSSKRMRQRLAAREWQSFASVHFDGPRIVECDSTALPDHGSRITDHAFSCSPHIIGRLSNTRLSRLAPFFIRF
jgi:hypothetical protein